MLIGADVKIFAVIGCPVEHSLSPIMYNTVFAELGMRCVYVAYKVEKHYLSDAIKGIKALGIKGLSVTIPHKSSVMQFLDKVDEEAKIIGAVNVVVAEEGQLVGYNTDGAGFIESFKNETGTPVADKVYVIIGAGGAARAIGVCLGLRGAKKIFVANRTVEQGQILADNIMETTGCVARGIPLTRDSLRKSIEEADVLVNATSVGMHPGNDEIPLDDSVFRRGLIVCDVVFNRTTELLQRALAHECLVMNGIGMLIEQGALAFELWTGVKPPKEVMRNVLQKVMTG
ncbi:shikimate dehydrogenase [Desulfallas sp. Bu1-1]|uniref:shikimate dehydrogenase n=1 Tax=Desulfallas sp. Bu1-1 TaxID=2787620 RepID=UPI00189D5B15|nr:shikimate dehydrogenase [Desulfallas sp. Bu1-1]MBF7082511.1 shikimate dehydrogenase [Desulfallas sp. Bu1-1]